MLMVYTVLRSIKRNISNKTKGEDFKKHLTKLLKTQLWYMLMSHLLLSKLFSYNTWSFLLTCWSLNGSSLTISTAFNSLLSHTRWSIFSTCTQFQNKIDKTWSCLDEQHSKWQGGRKLIDNSSRRTEKAILAKNMYLFMFSNYYIY